MLEKLISSKKLNTQYEIPERLSIRLLVRYHSTKYNRHSTPGCNRLVYIDTDVATCLKRITDRKGQSNMENFEDYLNCLQKAYEDYCNIFFRRRWKALPSKSKKTLMQN